jgi:amino acid transporter
MSNAVEGIRSGVGTASSRETAAKGAELTGHLGTLDIALATLAYAGPLAGTAGYITFLIAYGNGIGAPSAFIAVMVAFLFFAVGYGAMTKYVPNPGAFYAYITAGLGRPAGLGSSFLVLGSYLSIGVGFYGFAGLATKQFVEGHGGPQVHWWIYSLIYWVAVGTLAYFHVAISAKVLGVLLILEVIAVLVFDVVVFAKGGSEGISVQPFTWGAFTSGQLGIALIFGAALFAGFEATAIYREETRHPDKTIPRATIVVVLFIGIFYCITAWAFISGLGTSRAVELSTADPAGAFFTVATAFVGRGYFDIVTVLLLTSTFAAHLAIQNVTTRYVYSLSHDGVFPSPLGMAHKRHRSPSRASITVSSTYLVLTGCCVLAGLTAEQIYGWFAGLAAFTILAAMALTSLAAFVYFRRHREHPVSLWAGTVAPFIGTVCLAVMVYLGGDNLASLIAGSQTLANIMMIGAATVFVVGFITALVLRRRRPAVYQRIGRNIPSEPPVAAVV